MKRKRRATRPRAQVECGVRWTPRHGSPIINCFVVAQSDAAAVHGSFWRCYMRRLISTLVLAFCVACFAAGCSGKCHKWWGGKCDKTCTCKCEKGTECKCAKGAECTFPKGAECKCEKGAECKCAKGAPSKGEKAPESKTPAAPEKTESKAPGSTGK